MKKRNILIIALICAVLIGLGIGGFILIQNQNNQKIYREKLSEGQKYLSQMKYEEAEAAFEFALDKNPKDEDAYVGLYRVYSAQGQFHQAVYILENTRSSEKVSVWSISWTVWRQKMRSWLWMTREMCQKKIWKKFQRTL